MGSEEVIRCRQKRKEELCYIHGDKCALCGYNKAIVALEFHHINPEEKLYQLSTGNTHSWESDVAESKKCILVCANCHREIHSGLVTFPLKTSFIQERFEELNPQKERKIWKCQNCGAFVSPGATYCNPCRGKLDRKVERPSREELKKLIRTKPFTRIGEQYNVTDNAVRKWCKAEGLPFKKADINRYSDNEWAEI